MLAPPFRIKICGVRLMEDVHAAAAAGADAIGLNFHPPSVRSIDRASAWALAAEAKRHELCAVGVFVNEPAERVVEIATDVGLAAVQLHGDESLDDARQLVASGLPVVRAVRLAAGPLAVEAIEAEVAPWAEVGCAVLLDADAGAAYGGVGRRLDWSSLKAWREQAGLEPRPFILAGGLTPETVAEAIAESGAWGVDVASGVEASRGIKSSERINQFAHRARQSLVAS